MALKKRFCLWAWAALLCIKSQLIKLAVANKSEQVKLFRSMPCHEYVLIRVNTSLRPAGRGFIGKQVEPFRFAKVSTCTTHLQQWQPRWWTAPHLSAEPSFLAQTAEQGLFKFPSVASLAFQLLSGNSFFLTFVSTVTRCECDGNNCQVTTVLLLHLWEVTTLRHPISELFALFGIHFSCEHVWVATEVWPENFQSHALE